MQTPIGHTDRRSESATPYRGRGTPFNNWSTGLRGCAPRPVARERAPTRGAVHESDKSDKSDVLPKLVALPGIPTFVRGGSAAEGAILLETEYTKRGRRWGTGDPTCDLCISLLSALLGDLCIIPHLRRHFRDSGLVMCVSTLPSPSLSVPCIWGILQSPCRKSTAFSAKDRFAKVFLGEAYLTR